MAPSSAEKKAYNTKYAAANRAKKGLLDAVRSISAGRQTQPKTLKRYGWTITQVNRIRALDPRYKTVFEDNHDVKLDSVWANNPKPPLNALAADVQEQPAPTPPPVPKYDQCLVETPRLGSDLPISRRQINSFWQSNPDKNNMGYNAVRMVIKNGQTVAAKFNKRTNENK